MRSVRRASVISLVLPLGLAQCGGEKEEAKAPQSYTTMPAPTKYPPPKTASTVPEGQMVPASRVEGEADFRQGTATEMLDAAPLTDGQIVALTDAANAAEVVKARLALQRSQDSRVRQFAQTMIEHHGQARTDQSTVASTLALPPSESPRLIELRNDTLDNMRTLEASPDDIFDKTYVDIEIADQRRFLDSLDRGLIPVVDNADLKRLLENLRPMILGHLNVARDLGQVLQQYGPEEYAPQLRQNLEQRPR